MTRSARVKSDGEGNAGPQYMVASSIAGLTAGSDA